MDHKKRSQADLVRCSLMKQKHGPPLWNRAHPALMSDGDQAMQDLAFRLALAQRRGEGAELAAKEVDMLVEYVSQIENNQKEDTKNV